MSVKKYKKLSNTIRLKRRRLLSKRFLAFFRPQHRVFFVSAGILLVLLVGGSIAGYVTGLSFTGNSPDLAGPPFPGSLLVFQNVQGSPATNSTITVLRMNGAVVRQFTSGYTDSAFDQYAGTQAPFSSSLLMSNQLGDGTSLSVTKWALMYPDGETASIPPSLVGTLNNLWNGSGILNGDVFLVGSHQLYGIFEDTAGDDFQDIDLATGTVRTVLQIRQLGSSSLTATNVQPKDMNANQTEMSFVMNDVSVNGRDILTPSVVVYHIGGSVTITPLPARLDGVAPAQTSQAPMQYALSADGTLLAYQQTSQMEVDGVRTTRLITHVYNTQIGKDVAMTAGVSINLGVCQTPFSLSDDDAYLVTCGATSVAENAIIEVTNTSTGAVVKTLSSGNTANYSLASVGWSGLDTLVYTTNTASQGLPFNEATETAHSFNLSTGAQRTFPTGLGKLLMVIHTQ